MLILRDDVLGGRLTRRYFLVVTPIGLLVDMEMPHLWINRGIGLK